MRPHLSGLTLILVFLGASQRLFPKVTEQGLEKEVQIYLRDAPVRASGTRRQVILSGGTVAGTRRQVILFGGTVAGTRRQVNLSGGTVAGTRRPVTLSEGTVAGTRRQVILSGGTVAGQGVR